MTDKAMADKPFLRNFVKPSLLTATACGVRMDYSRQRLTKEQFDGLLEHGQKIGVLEAHRRMLSGEVVNASESRAALHTALRAFSPDAPMHEEVLRERRRQMDFARSVRDGTWRGCRADRITDVINVGIGGSDMGPRAVYHALRSATQKIRVHFLSTVDGVLLERTLARCNPLSTLVVVSSKSFGTRETLVNAAAVDQWLLDAGIAGPDRNHHIVIASANPSAADQMCLPRENQFNFWEWVGGRFSVWGAVGLPLAIALGPEIFTEFLQGAAEMDRHSSTAPLNRNLPALLALFEYWNSRCEKIITHCLLPYDERLRMTVPWLQQLEMESLGKTRSSDGGTVEGNTGQVVWGANGNEAQHSFGQWLREGTADTSIDIVWSEMPGHRYAEHYRVLVANARAQAEALVTRPDGCGHFNAVTAITLDAVTPRRLGAFMAMYEHKTTMLGTLYGVNPFDQPGVELGKRLSRRAEMGESPIVALKREVTQQ